MWSPRLGNRELVSVLFVFLFVYLARIKVCPFSLPLGVRIWLRLVLVALPALFYKLFWTLQKPTENWWGLMCVSIHTLVTNSGRASVTIGVCTWMRKKSPRAGRENRSKLVRCTERTETDSFRLSDASETSGLLSQVEPLDKQGALTCRLCALLHWKATAWSACIINWINPPSTTSKTAHRLDANPLSAPPTFSKLEKLLDVQGLLSCCTKAMQNHVFI